MRMDCAKYQHKVVDSGLGDDKQMIINDISVDDFYTCAEYAFVGFWHLNLMEKEFQNFAGFNVPLPYYVLNESGEPCKFLFEGNDGEHFFMHRSESG